MEDGDNGMKQRVTIRVEIGCAACAYTTVVLYIFAGVALWL